MMKYITEAASRRKPTPTDIDSILARFAKRHRLSHRVACLIAELAGIGPREVR